MTAPTATMLEHEIGENGLLAIRLRSSDIRIRAVDGPSVRVMDPTGTLGRSVVVERAPGSLSLRADGGISIGIGSLGVRAGRRTPDIEVEVPRRATVVIETSSGDVAVVGLSGDQRYRTASGEITLRDVSGRLTLDAVSGTIQVGMAGTCAVSARTVSGDLSLHGDAIESVLLATTSGDVRLDGRFDGAGPFGIETVSGDTVLGLVGDLRVFLRSVTGDLRSDATGTVEGSRGSRTLTIGQDGPTLAIRSTSGDVRVVLPSVVSAPPQLAVPSVAPPALAQPEGSSDMGRADRTVADPSLPILESLERGDIDVEEAIRRLATLDASESTGPSDETHRTATPS